MNEGKRRTSGPDTGARDPTASSARRWDRLQSAVDEAEVQSFSASDPQSSWAGPDRESLAWPGNVQKRRAS